MYRLYLFFFLTAVFFCNVRGMTKAQIKKTLTLVKNQCMPKNEVTEDQVGKISEGEFLAERSVMCYVACVYKTAGVTKNKKLSKDLVYKQVDLFYPQEVREQVKITVEKCIPLQNKYDDMCEGIFNAAKCLYEEDPNNFIFP